MLILRLDDLLFSCKRKQPGILKEGFWTNMLYLSIRRPMSDIDGSSDVASSGEYFGATHQAVLYEP